MGLPLAERSPRPLEISSGDVHSLAIDSEERLYSSSEKKKHVYPSTLLTVSEFSY